MKIEPIETKRLTIRNYERTDLEFAKSIWNDPKMGKYLSDPDIEHMDETYRRVLETLDEDEDCCYLIAEKKNTGERIGTCSFFPSEDGMTYDLGYCIHEKYWQQGYGTEEVQGMITYAKAQGAKYITVSVAQENPGSNGIMHKLNFQAVQEGSFRKRGTNIVYKEYLYWLEINNTSELEC